MNSTFSKYEPLKGAIRSDTHGFLVASEPGESVTYGLVNAQERGKTIIGASTKAVSYTHLTLPTILRV